MKNNLTAMLDTGGTFYTISPLLPGNRMTVTRALRTIRESTGRTWKQIGEFIGVNKQSIAFGIAYGSRAPEYIKKYGLDQYLVIDSEQNKAYLYHHDHKPESIPVPHVGPTITNREAETQSCTAGIPSVVTSRITVKDPLDRILKMNLAVVNGRIIGLTEFDIKGIEEYALEGKYSTLNRTLKKIAFVPTAEGEASITITVDDNEGESDSVVTTTIKLTAKAGVVESVPTINLPEENPVIKQNQRTKFTPVTFTDTDDKIMQLTITPIGCRLIGFKTYAHAVENGENFIRMGKVDDFNSNIANLEVIALKDAAQIAFELKYGATIIRDHLIFTVESDVKTEPEEPEDDQQQDTVSTMNVTPTSTKTTQAKTTSTTTQSTTQPTTQPATQSTAQSTAPKTKQSSTSSTSTTPEKNGVTVSNGTTSSTEDTEEDTEVEDTK